MEGHCSTGQSPQWAVVLLEEEEDVVIMCIVMYRTSLSLCPWAGHLSRVVPADAFFLCDKAGMLRDKIKGTSYYLSTQISRQRDHWWVLMNVTVAFDFPIP